MPITSVGPFELPHFLNNSNLHAGLKAGAAATANGMFVGVAVSGFSVAVGSIYAALTHQAGIGALGSLNYLLKGAGGGSLISYGAGFVSGYLNSNV